MNNCHYNPMGYIGPLLSNKPLQNCQQTANKCNAMVDLCWLWHQTDLLTTGKHCYFHMSSCIPCWAHRRIRISRLKSPTVKAVKGFKLRWRWFLGVASPLPSLKNYRGEDTSAAIDAMAHLCPKLLSSVDRVTRLPCRGLKWPATEINAPGHAIAQLIT